MLTLVDTSVWIDHFRRGNTELIRLLENEQVLTHPLVLGEIACGNLRNREVVLDSLLSLPQAKSTTFLESLSFIEKRKIYGRGLGIVDVQILAACLLSKANLFTLDKTLEKTFLEF